MDRLTFVQETYLMFVGEAGRRKILIDGFI
jgi:hypothetical protein